MTRMQFRVDSIAVLHVDDEPDLGEMAAEFVEREDERFDVEVAANANEGLDRLASGTYDCVVSDYDMPGRNGIEFLEAVRADHPDLPFVLYTGKGSEDVASDAISAGVTDYLQKETGTSQYTVLANRIRNAVEQYHARTELADREQRLRLFFEESPLGAIEWNENFEFVRQNDTAREILGYADAELEGEPWTRIVPDSEREHVREVLSTLFENEGGHYSVNENVRKDGERIVCEWHNRVVTEDGDVVAMFSKFQDITERTEREGESRRRRHRLEQILKTVPACVVQVDPSGEFVYANRRAEAVLGLEADGVTERTYNDPAWDITDLDGDPIPDEALPFRRVRDSGEPLYGYRHTIEWPDGTRKVLLVNGAPLFDEDGNIKSTVFALTDVTDHEQREDELR